MDINLLEKELSELISAQNLEKFHVLPQFTNIRAIVQSSNVEVATTGFENDAGSNRCNVNIGVIVSSNERNNLNSLVHLIISIVRNKIFSNSKKTNLNDGVFFTPESGKWICRINFIVPLNYTYYGDNDDNDILSDRKGKIKTIELNYT